MTLDIWSVHSVWIEGIDGLEHAKVHAIDGAARVGRAGFCSARRGRRSGSGDTSLSGATTASPWVGAPSVFGWHRTNERLRRNASGTVWQQRSAAPRVTRMHDWHSHDVSQAIQNSVAVE
jgi:hypothetical protein